MTEKSRSFRPSDQIVEPYLRCYHQVFCHSLFSTAFISKTMQAEILWLDQHSQSTESFQQKLGHYQFVRFFHDVDTCVNYIETHLTNDLFLIASGTMSKIIVPRINHHPHIKQIFVFCAKMLEHVDWASDYEDKLLLYDHHDDLLERLWLEMSKYFRSLAKHYTEQANMTDQWAKQYKQICG